MNKGTRTLFGAIWVGLSSPLAAVAQDAAAPAPTAAAAPELAPAAAAEAAPDLGKDKLETVYVTARRSAEDLQSVPVAVTAFSADDLDREKINSTQDLQGKVPSLTISSASQLRGTELPNIRGQGASFGASPGVVIYFAEVPVQTHSVTQGQGGPGKFFDLANLQVLKGSQGTLFGRNTTGGALLLEPHKPDNRYEFAIKQEGSQLSGYTAENVINLPLVDNQLMMRLSSQYVTRGGFTHDVVSGRDYDNKSYWTSRLGITWRPADNVENYLLAYYTYNNENGTAYVINNINRPGLNYALLLEVFQLAGLPTPTTQQEIATFQTLANTSNIGCLWLNLNTGSSNCGQDILDAQHARDVRHVQLGPQVPYDFIKTGTAVDQFKWELNEQLALRNIVSYSFLKHSFNWNLSGSRAAFNNTDDTRDTYSTNAGQFTEELQLQGSGLEDRLKFVVGGYYQSIRPIGPQKITEIGLFFNLPSYIYSVVQTTYAPYAQASYDLGGLAEFMDGFKLTLGGRYTSDSTSGSSNAGLGPHSASIRKSTPTWTIGLDKQLDNTLLYGKMSRGYKAGGFEVIAANPADYTFKPEYVINYELGQKSDFHLGGAPARLDTAAFYTGFSDMQKDATDSGGGQHFPPAFGAATFNVGKSQIMGLETEGSVRPLPGLTLSANYALSYGKYVRYTLVNNGTTPFLDCSGQLIPTNNGQNTAAATEDLHCIPLQFLPRHQASATLQYLLPVDVAGGKLNGSVTYSWTDRQYATPFEVPAQEPEPWLASRGLLNASLSLDWLIDAKQAVELRLFGTNLTDKVYRIANSNVWNTVYYESSIYGEPRILGLQLRYGFGE
jgi:iron complex outermembrane receptor protein